MARSSANGKGIEMEMYVNDERRTTVEIQTTRAPTSKLIVMIPFLNDIVRWFLWTMDESMPTYIS
jgi:hypothetical protein